MDDAAMIPSMTPNEVINALTSEYINVYGLNLATGGLQVYRFAGQAVGVLENIYQERSYEDVMASYIRQNVLPEDQEMMVRMTARDRLIRELTQKDAYIAHYRVRRDGELHYYLMKCVRIGTPETFSHIILAFASENAGVLHNMAIQQQLIGDPKIKRKVLVVEDNTLNRKILCSILEDSYSVIEAVDGLDAMNVVREHYQDISIILLDVNMPRMNGFEFMEAIRQDPLFREIPVVITTGSRGTGDEEQWLELGAADFIAKPYNPNVALRRIATIIRLRESAVTLHAIEHDDLTGVYTRRAFIHHAQQILKLNPDTQYSMLLSDIENFRHINERYGYATGDEILRRTGSMLMSLEKSALCGRYSGDQFVLLFPQFQGAEGYYKRLLKDLGNSLPVTNVVIKFGMIEDAEHDLAVSTLCDHMLTALRTIKHQYGKISAKYDDKLKKWAEQELLIEESMQQALQERQFQVYYQPKHDVSAGCTAGAEALVRWIHPEMGFLNPGLFISLFEKNGFITSLDRYVWEEVCRTVAEWKAAGRRIVPVSVNLSRRDFEQADIVDWLIQTVDSYELDHSLLHVEITESCYAENPEVVQQSATALHNAGFPIEMDDFGSGYSSLSALSSLPLDVLKLDTSILRHDVPGSDRSVLEYTMQLAKIMRLKTVQEGVETVGQLERVRSLGCDYVQGFYYSRPIPRGEFEEYLMKN